MQIKPAVKRKEVIVVGTGPAGLEAAWVAAARGHKVTLYEKNETLGGQSVLQPYRPSSRILPGLLPIMSTCAKSTSVALKIGCEATAEEIVAKMPDAVIVATGSEPSFAEMTGIDGDRVACATDILEGKKQAGLNVLIVGGGMVGCEVADFLGEHLIE